MKVMLDKKNIQSMNIFHNLTSSRIIDCIDAGDELYFVVAEGQYGLAVGKNGIKIKHAERLFKKTIKIFEYSPNLEKFVQNLIPEASEIKIDGKIIYVKIKQNLKPKVIGKNGRKIKTINLILSRLFDIEALKIK